MQDTFFSERFPAEEIRKIIGKRRKYMGLPSGIVADVFYLIAIILSVTILLPVYFLAILPVTALYWIFIILPGRLLGSSSQAGNGDAENDDVLLPQAPTAATVPALESREFDVVVFGVTGLCGRITAEYLLAHYGADGSRLKIAFAGRSMPKLQSVRAELSNRTKMAGADDVELIVADSADLESLLNMARRTRVVATTVGPYNKYGEPLVKACAYTGTGYCDLTGEQDFVSAMARKYGAVAAATGARIVHLTGVDSIPSELMTTLVCESFKAQYGHAPTRVEHILMGGGGGAPGGTIDTVIASIEGKKPNSSTKTAPPARVAPKGKTRTSPFVPRYLDSVSHWTGPWIMGYVNSRTVQRSNALTGFAPDLEYIEQQTYPSLLCIIASMIPMMVGFTLFTLPPVRSLLFAVGALPKPGEGAVTRGQMAKGFMDFRTTAYDAQGNKVAMRMAGLGDLGCILTAVFQGESAACLAQECGSAPLVGAGLTPVAVMGAQRLADRLRKSGRVLIE